MTKNKGGRPPHEPTEASRKQVKALSAYGIPQEEICKVVGVSKPTLEKHYRLELDIATAQANAQVAESLFKKATGSGSQSVTAAIFWLKTRAKWKEPPQGHEHSGPNGDPIKTEDVTARDILLGRIAELSARNGSGEGS